MSEKITISINDGKIQGCKKKSTFSEAEFYSFFGVPYGQSTANARFKDPVPVKPWKTILNCCTEKGGCLQYSLNKRIITGTEDCLYNNIYTPKIPQKADNHSLKAVIVALHPGGYHHGTADPDYFGSPDYVMHNDIVYVCVSFRLHILGFLNLDLKECSGNQAFKDIILSLEWIQKNIAFFGGDPNNVTLHGASSGALLVNDLMISPRAKGLFHKAVIMGMYKYCPSIPINEENFTIALEMAEKLGYNGPSDRKKLLLYYKKLDMKKFLYARGARLSDERQLPLYPASAFSSTIDSGENAVLPFSDKQKNLESMARVPLMIGFCEREAIIGFLPQYKAMMKEKFYKSIRQHCYGWGRKLNDEQLEYIQKRVESFYMNSCSVENASLHVKCNIQTDIALSDVYSSLIDVVAKDLPSSVYVYKFEFEGNVIKTKDAFNFTFEEPLNGTYHMDDYCHWSKFPLPFISNLGNFLTPDTEEMVHKFTKLICTFAKSGNPNYEGITTQWKPTTVEKPCYLSINTDLQMVEGKLNGNRMEFWENLKKEIEGDAPKFA